jgi:hypothetical protein
MSSWTPTIYKTKNWAAYNRALKQRGSLSFWFDAEMDWCGMPSGKRSRQQAYSDAAIQACLTIKVLFGLPLRQATGFVESLLKLIGLNWSVPDFSTLCRRQRTLSVALPYQGSAGPLHLLIDSTGIKAEGEGAISTACFACACLVISGIPLSMAGQTAASGARYISIARQANGTFAERRIDEKTLEIRAIEATSSSIGDAPVLPDLLNQIPPDEEISSVTADGA